MVGLDPTISGNTGIGSGIAFGADVKVTLSGANEVPPVTTSASGDGTMPFVGNGGAGNVGTQVVQMRGLVPDAEIATEAIARAVN